MCQVNTTWGEENQIFLVNWGMDRYGGIFNISFDTHEVTFYRVFYIGPCHFVSSSSSRKLIVKF